VLALRHWRHLLTVGDIWPSTSLSLSLSLFFPYMYGLILLFDFSRTLSNRLSESYHGIGVFLGSQFSLKLGNGSITAFWLLIISNQDLVEGLALACFAPGVSCTWTRRTSGDTRPLIE
jgi:hypothetical protein